MRLNAPSVMDTGYLAWLSLTRKPGTSTGHGFGLDFGPARMHTSEYATSWPVPYDAWVPDTLSLENLVEGAREQRQSLLALDLSGSLRLDGLTPSVVFEEAGNSMFADLDHRTVRSRAAL